MSTAVDTVKASPITSPRIIEHSSAQHISLNDVIAMAKFASDSGLFGDMNHNQCVALMLLCQAKNMHPMLATERYHIIKGRSSMKAETMMAEFQNAGGRVKWLRLDAEAAEAEFSHPSGGTVTIEWTIEMARKAGLAGKDNYKNYGRAMLRSRVVSEGVRTVLPGAVLGVYTPEEIMDMPDAETVRTVTGTIDLAAITSKEMSEEVKARGKKKSPEVIDVTPPSAPVSESAAMKEIDAEIGATEDLTLEAEAPFMGNDGKPQPKF